MDAAALPVVLTKADVAVKLRKSEDTVRRYAEAGILLGRRTPGGWLFSRRWLSGWLNEPYDDSDLDPRAMDTAEAAAFLRRSPETILRYAVDGIIPATETPGHWLFSPLALLAWLEHADGS